MYSSINRVCFFWLLFQALLVRVRKGRYRIDLDDEAGGRWQAGGRRQSGEGGGRSERAALIIRMKYDESK